VLPHIRLAGADVAPQPSDHGFRAVTSMVEEARTRSTSPSCHACFIPESIASAWHYWWIANQTIDAPRLQVGDHNRHFVISRARAC
jgi:hypothetical protein